MFVRIKSTPNSPRKSVQIVESYRRDGKVRQRILRHVGVAENDGQLEKIKQLAEFIMLSMEPDGQTGLFSAEEEVELIRQSRPAVTTPSAQDAPLNVNLRQLRETARITTGFHEVYGQLYDQLGFNHILGSGRKASARVLRDLVMARLAQPVSKLASARLLTRDFGIEIDENQIYRMMDHLDTAHCECIQRIAGQAALDLLGQKVDVIFFDCTTLYFESFDEDNLRQKGFSKDHKSAETQVLLALMVTQEGLPIGYQLYPGATWEGHTLGDAVVSLRQRFDLEKVVIVADSGLLCKQNLALLNGLKVPYILAARLKKLPAALKSQVLDHSRYQPLTEGEWYQEIPHNEERLIVTYSEKRARKDAHERIIALNKLKKSHQGKSAQTALKGRAATFMQVEGGAIEFDPDKIAENSQWDGLWGLVTNMEEISVSDALSHYRGLWQVEETFRLSKHDLKLRPVFHWSPRRIEAHIAVCFIALTCMRWLSYSCSLRYQRLSPEVIRNELAHVQVSILEDKVTKRRYGIPSQESTHAAQLFKIVGKTLSTTPFEIK